MSRYNDIAGSVDRGHGTSDLDQRVPTADQFAAYRTRRRESVRRIVRFIKAPWHGHATDQDIQVLRRLRREHSESIVREKSLKKANLAVGM